MWLCRAIHPRADVEAASSILVAAGATSISDFERVNRHINFGRGKDGINFGWAALHHFLGVTAAASIPGAAADASNLVEAIATSIRARQRLHQFPERQRLHRDRQ